MNLVHALFNEVPTRPWTIAAKIISTLDQIEVAVRGWREDQKPRPPREFNPRDFIALEFHISSNDDADLVPGFVRRSLIQSVVPSGMKGFSMIYLSNGDTRIVRGFPNEVWMQIMGGASSAPRADEVPVMRGDAA